MRIAKILSPKICFSEHSLELAVSARCALQYVVGLIVEPRRNLALVSYGQMDRQMHLAALPLDRIVALARTHVLPPSSSSPHSLFLPSAPPALNTGLLIMASTVMLRLPSISSDSVAICVRRGMLSDVS